MESAATSRTAPQVQILMATYNGEAFLDEQLASLLSQDWPNVSILVRDDGSSDGTVTILRRRQAEGAPMHIVTGEERSGPMGNFDRLMQLSTAQYLAFCDQDDIWDRDKLSLAMQRMLTLEQTHSASTPILVFSDMRLIDQQGSVISPSLWTKARVRPQGAGFGHMLAQNLVTGCSVIVNRTLMELALPLPAGAMMHDYWLALLAAAFGVASPIERPTVSYRQHAANVVGAGRQLSLHKRLQRLVADPATAAWLQAAAEQANLFLQRYGSRLTPQQIRQLQAMGGLVERSGLDRALYSFRQGIVRTEAWNEVQFLLRLAFGARKA